MQGKSFFSLLDVDKYGGHMVKVRRFRDIICDNMSRTYVYALIYTHICVYAYTHIYGCLHIFARQTVLPLLQFAHYLGHMVILWRFRAHILRIYPHIWQYVFDIRLPVARQPSLPLSHLDIIVGIWSLTDDLCCRYPRTSHVVVLPMWKGTFVALFAWWIFWWAYGHGSTISCLQVGRGEKGDFQ